MTDPVLTAEQVAEFRRRGFLVVRGLFDADAVRELAAQVAEVEAWPETPGRHMMYFEQGPDGERLLNRVEKFADFHAGLDRVLAGDAMRGSVSDLFGEPAVLFKEKINFKLPGGGGFDAHQDAQAGWNDYASLFVTAAVALDAATPENGCLELGHWKHRLDFLGELWEPLRDEQLEGVEFVPYPMAPGDAAFFDSYLPHRSSPNRSDEARRVLYVTYNRASEGDHRQQYYADKRRSYPPDCERDPGRDYAYRV